MGPNVTTVIEARLAENKTSVKTYKSFAAAEKAGNELGSQFATVRGIEDHVPYIVVFLPNYNRYTTIFMQSHWLTRHKEGGFIGWFALKGFYTI